MSIGGEIVLEPEDLAAPVPGGPGDVLTGPSGSGGDAGEISSTGSFWRQVVSVFLQNRLALLGLGFIVFMVLFCFVGPHIYVTNQLNGNEALLSNVPQNGPPSAAHLLGSDNNSFDELGRLMFGGQADLEVALAAAMIATVVGVVWGAVAGFVGGALDAIMMRFVDALLSIPALLLLIVLAEIFKPSTIFLIVLIGLVAWLVPARLVRGEALSLRTREYVQAVRVAGGSGRRIVLRHIIPNAIGTIVVNASFQVADAILFLATLGYLGLGISPPGTDWGTMLSTALSNGALQNNYWWEIWAPGLAIVFTVVAFNFIGDALRDALEVRLQRR
jgi:peptide/nickel transport system permease protein